MGGNCDTMQRMEDHEWKQGGCFCGAIRYCVEGDAVWQAGCTCNTCVKMHTAPYVVWAGFDRNNYKILSGEPTQYISSKHVIREFCPICGSTLTYGKDAKGLPELEAAAQLIYIAVASFDDPNSFPPAEIVHGREKIEWMNFAGNIPVREFVSKSAGDLQFGGIDPELAQELANQHFGPDKKDKT
jgi:hypothetical protein